MRNVLVAFMAIILIPSTAFAADSSTAEGLFNLPEHFDKLKLDKPGSNGWSGVLASAEKPAAIFYEGEQANIDVKIVGQLDAKLTVEVVPVGFEFGGFGGSEGGDPMVTGQLNILTPRGDAKRAEITFASADDKQKGILKLRNLPTERFGLYAVIVEAEGKGRQPVATIVRGFQPRDVDRWASPVMYHMSGPVPAAELKRVGYLWVRTDGFPNWGGADGGKDKPFDWSRHDAAMKVFRDNKLYAISNMYGSPGWSYDQLKAKAYDMSHNEEYDNLMGDFAEEAVRRYCGEDGQGPLQVIDYWNEPWEGGGISGWNADSIRYRQLYKTLYERAHKGSKFIKVGAASSIMNTEDKFFAWNDGTDWTKYLDVLTDHYVLPSKIYGPRIAEKLGVFSIETETWLGYNEKRFTGVVAHFLAAGQKMVNPNHPSQVFWRNSAAGLMCKPAGAAANVVLHFLAGRPFKRVVFLDHLPWLYQFGECNDAVFLISADMSFIEDDPSHVIYGQIKPNGRMAIDSLGGKLVAADIWGNPYPAKDGTMDVPFSSDPVWLTGKGLKEKQIIAAVEKAAVTGVRPVEIILRDFTAVPEAGSTLNVEIHNVLNREITGTVQVDAPEGLALKADVQDVKLAAGERKAVPFIIANFRGKETNVYPVGVHFTSNAGKADWKEAISANVIARGTPKIDGDLADWAAAPGVPVVGKKSGVDLTARAWRPWEQQADVKAEMAEFRLMADDKFLYVACRERNAAWQPKPRLSTRNDDLFFGDKAPMLHTNRTTRWDDKAPDWSAAQPYEGNCLQIAISAGLGGKAHGIPDPKNVPPAMVSVPDTDYEYSVWGAPDGAEIWRSYYLGGPRVHYCPRILPKDKYNGVPPGATAMVKKAGDDVIYEIAIPWADMKAIKASRVKPGQTLNITFRLPASNVMLGAGRSATRDNGLTLQPYWQASPSNTIAWGIGK